MVTSYDAQNRVISKTLPNSSVTQFGYDLAGRLTSVTDAVSNVTAFTYDALGRLLTETDPRGKGTTYTYDAVGRMVNREDRNGRDRAFEYDLAGRRTKEKWLDAMGGVLRTVNYAYNSDSQLTSISDPSASYAYTYDAEGKLKTIDNLGTPGVPRVVLTYTYDTRDNVTLLADNLNGSIAYTHDNGDRMTGALMTVNGTQQPKVTITQDAANRITGLYRQDMSPTWWPQQSTTVSTSLTYDNADRPTAITHSNGLSQTLASYAYTWNAASELTREVSNDGTVDHTYDPTSQLLSSVGWRNETYTYDGTGNRTMTGYQTGTGNRLLSDGVYNYTYDDEGNRLTRTTIATGEVVESDWDYRNRLVEVRYRNSSGTLTRQATYTYDPHDKLIGRWVDADGAGAGSAVQSWTVHAAENPYADFNGAGSLTNRYLYGPSVDMLFARVDSTGNITWYLTDLQGSVRDLANTFGQVIDHIKYDSFGRVISESNPSVGDRFKYTGREWESAVDLYYYRARWYDPAAGRFLSEDPLGFSAGDENLSRYVGNAPTMRTDPSGMDWVDDYSIWFMTSTGTQFGYQAMGMWIHSQATFAGIDLAPASGTSLFLGTTVFAASIYGAVAYSVPVIASAAEGAAQSVANAVVAYAIPVAVAGGVAAKEGGYRIVGNRFVPNDSPVRTVLTGAAAISAVLYMSPHKVSTNPEDWEDETDKARHAENMAKKAEEIRQQGQDLIDQLLKDKNQEHNKVLRRRLHDQITKREYTEQEIRDILDGLLNQKTPIRAEATAGPSAPQALRCFSELT